jgi:hypothetical protein
MDRPIWHQWPAFFRGSDEILYLFEKRAAFARKIRRHIARGGVEMRRKVATDPPDSRATSRPAIWVEMEPPGGATEPNTCDIMQL